jgi:hypothetical protein
MSKKPKPENVSFNGLSGAYLVDVMLRSAREATKKAVENAHALGLSVPFGKDGKVFWLRPDGKITKREPRRNKIARTTKHHTL